MQMQETLDTIITEAEKGGQAVVSRAEFEAFKAGLMGPKGSFTQVRKQMGQIPKEDRPAFGKKINQAKNRLEKLLAEILDRIEQRELSSRLGAAIDPTLPSPEQLPGSLHPLTQIRDELCSIFRQIGFVVAEGSEVETEFFCFDALNTPPGHPARDLQDTYYLQEKIHFANIPQRHDERYALRPHTSTVQIRAMQEQQPPLRIISPGRCFRRDTPDATHSANFHQIEGLYVDKNVTVKDLKADLDYCFQSLMGKDARTRFRPHFFPYTEPSFEVDFHSGHLAKVKAEWTEIMGCGMVDPTVFEAVGYDPEVWTGYAFGMGIERIAMILYGVDDIRYFYQNDLRFLHQFA